MVFAIQYPEINLITKLEQQPKIKCIIRNKWLICTPEEWVRQHFLYYLINTKKYPKQSIAVEKGFMVNGVKKRFDIIIYDANFEILFLIECKKETVILDAKTWSQTLAYNIEFSSAYLVITNGKQAMCCKTKPEIKFLNEIPMFK